MFRQIRLTPADARKLASRMRRFRKRNHLLQRELAAMLGIHRQTVIAIENRQNVPYAKIIPRLAAAERQVRLNERARDELDGLE